MKKEIIVIALLFLGITLFFFYPIFKGHIPFPGDLLVGNSEPYKSNMYFSYPPGGVPHKAQGSDVIKESFPWKTFVIDQLKQGQIPFWTPHNFSGNPLMANLQSAVFYPGNMFFFLLPFNAAWTLLIFSAPLLTGFFTYLFLRHLFLSKVASFFGGSVFAFSSYMVVWLEYGNITHTYLWLPLALLFVERLTKAFTRKDLFLLLLTLLLSLSAGYIQGYFYLLLLVVSYFFTKGFINRTLTIKKIISFLFVIAAPFFLFLFQILSTAELFKDSSRSGYTIKQIEFLLNPIWYTITTIIPNFFGHPASRNHWFEGTYIERVSYLGLIPFILAISAVFSFARKKEVRFFSIVFILCFILATDFFINKFLYLLPIPIFSTTVPTRIFGLFVFVGSILAAVGFDYFLQKKQKKHLLLSLFGVSFLIFISWIFVFTAPLVMQSEWITNLSITKRNLVLPTLFSGLFALIIVIHFFGQRIIKKMSLPTIGVAIVVIIISLFDLFYFFHKITPFAPQEFIYPKTPVVDFLRQQKDFYRFWGYGAAYIGSNFQTLDGTYSPEGEDPLHLRDYTEFIATSKTGTIPQVLPRPDANIAAGYGVGQLEENQYRQKILNLLGVKYILNKDESLGNEYRADTATFSEKNYKLIWQNTPWQVYENLNVAPRAFLTTDYRIVTPGQKTIDAFFTAEFNEKQTILLEKDPKIKKQPLSNAQVTIVNYQPNKVVLMTKSDVPSLLFLSDTYSSSWKATVDNENTPVYKANYAFRAVAVPSGEHTIIFSYADQSFKKGLLFSGIFVLIIALFFWRVKFNKQ